MTRSRSWRHRAVLAVLIGVLGFVAILLLRATQHPARSAVQRVLVEPTGLRNANRIVSLKPISEQLGLLDSILSTPSNRAAIAAAAGVRAGEEWSAVVVITPNTATADIVTTAENVQTASSLARASAAQTATLLGGPRSSYSVQRLGVPTVAELSSGIGMIPWVVGLLLGLLVLRVTSPSDGSASGRSRATRLGSPGGHPVGG